MRERRGDVPDHQLARGPGNLTRALGVSAVENGKAVGVDVRLVLSGERVDVVVARRIGINLAVDEKRRFFARGSRSVTRPSYI